MKIVASFSLLAFLPALTFAFFLPFPMHFENTNVNETPKITPDDICPFIHYIDNDLCTNTFSSVNSVTREVVKNTIFLHYHNQTFDPTQLCPLFSYLNKTYCTSSKTTNTDTNAEPVKTDIANQLKIIHHIFESIKNNTNDSYSESDYDLSEQIDPKELCPLIELVDKTFCKSDTLFINKLVPKDLCPILELVDTKLCS
jgi:hypothetical protein